MASADVSGAEGCMNLIETLRAAEKPDVPNLITPRELPQVLVNWTREAGMDTIALSVFDRKDADGALRYHRVAEWTGLQNVLEGILGALGVTVGWSATSDRTMDRVYRDMLREWARKADERENAD